jgi:hypothetical protein
MNKVYSRMQSEHEQKPEFTEAASAYAHIEAATSALAKWVELGMGFMGEEQMWGTVGGNHVRTLIDKLRAVQNRVADLMYPDWGQ